MVAVAMQYAIDAAVQQQCACTPYKLLKVTQHATTKVIVRAKSAIAQRTISRSVLAHLVHPRVSALSCTAPPAGC